MGRCKTCGLLLGIGNLGPCKACGKETNMEATETAVAVREDRPLPVQADTSIGAILNLPDPTHGIAECPISEKEGAILRAPINPDAELNIRWDGVVYMPGAVLRKRMLDAFGPGAWAMRQEAPIIYDAETGEIVVDYSMWIKGCYVSRAMAGWSWNPNNKRMSKSDAIESAQTECLRRLTKNLGIGLELWMPGVCDKYKKQYSVETEYTLRERSVQPSSPADKEFEKQQRQLIQEYLKQQHKVMNNHRLKAGGVPRKIRRILYKKSGHGNRRDRKAKARLARIEEKYFG